MEIKVNNDENLRLDVYLASNTDFSRSKINNLIDSDSYKDIKYGIKLCNKNIGFNGKFYTFPYFMTFLLKRYIKETK